MYEIWISDVWGNERQYPRKVHPLEAIPIASAIAEDDNLKVYVMTDNRNDQKPIWGCEFGKVTT